MLQGDDKKLSAGFKRKKKKKALEKGTDRILVLPLRCLGMRDRQGSV